MRDWPAWTKPREPTILDNVVEKIIADGHAFLPRDELDKVDIPCPYFHVRMGIALAAARASTDAVGAHARRNEIAQEYEDLAEAVKRLRSAASIERFERLIFHDRRNLYDPQSRLADEQIADEANAALRRVRGGLNAIRSDLKLIECFADQEKRHLTHSGRMGDFWSITFVIGFSKGWLRLTGKKTFSSGSDTLQNVLNAGAILLGRPKDRWDSVVRAAAGHARKLSLTPLKGGDLLTRVMFRALSGDPLGRMALQHIWPLQPLEIRTDFLEVSPWGPDLKEALSRSHWDADMRVVAKEAGQGNMDAIAVMADVSSKAGGSDLAFLNSLKAEFGSS